MRQDLPKQESTPDSSSVFLEIGAQGEEGSSQIPVLIQNLSGSLVTLVVEKPRRLAGWETLQGQGGQIRLTPRGSHKPVALQGTVAWARFGGQGRCQLHLGLELAHPHPATHKLLEGYIAHTPKDIKELWDRWDEVQETSAATPRARKLYLAGLGLMLVGMILQLPASKVVKVIGWILWFLGSLGVIGKYLWPRKAAN